MLVRRRMSSVPLTAGNGPAVTSISNVGRPCRSRIVTLHHEVHLWRTSCTRSPELPMSSKLAGTPSARSGAAVDLGRNM